MILESYKTFCILPWVHSFIDATGILRPCSLSNIKEKSVSWKKININQFDSLLDARNSDNFKQIRMQMLNNEIPSPCVKCFKSELKNSASMRTINNYTFSKQINFDKIISNTKVDGTISTQLKSIDWSLGTNCNNKCVACSPQSSSAWASELKTLDIKDEGLKKILRDLKNKYETDWTEKLKINSITNFSDLSKVEEISFSGGDVFLSASHLKLLDHFIDIGRSKDIELVYSLSSFTEQEEMLKKWSKFKVVKIKYSIDGIGERFNYLRFPSDYNSTIKELDILNASKIESINLGFQITVSALNILDIPELIKFLYSKYGEIDLNFSCVHWPNFLSTSIYSRSTIQEILTKYEELIEYMKKNTKNKKNIKRLGNIISYLNKPLLVNYEKMLINYLEALDFKRGTSYKKTFPEILPLLNFES